MEQKTLVVCVAHPGDFVWRAGGAIALMARRGWRTVVICATFGAKGEAGTLWGAPDATLKSVTKARRQEAQAAAIALGCELILLEKTDYPLEVTTDDIVALNQHFRALQPTVVLTHTAVDPGNTDHPAMSELVMGARMMALAPGYGSDMAAPFSVYYFEPHQPELSIFKADILLDISDVWEEKRTAMHAIPSQKGVWDYYERVALQRGSHASRRAKAMVTHAEAFQKVLPTVEVTFR